MEAWSNIPVIVLTAMHLTPDQRHQLETGVQSIIPKVSSAGTQWVGDLSEIVRANMSRPFAPLPSPPSVAELVVH